MRNTHAGPRDSYFFLSYAHSPPLGWTLAEGQAPDPPDAWVSTFFHDLTDEVRSRATSPLPRSPGFFDQAIPVGSDWKATLSRALGSAEVFVPLYSPEYRSRSWPGREWACFERRLMTAGVKEPLGRFAPVLWIPLPAGQRMRGLRQAEELAPEAAAGPYRENGLRALLRLTPYRDAYQLVVGRLAARIVRLAERQPIPPSWVPDIDDVESAFNPESAPAVFVVVVLAPASDGAPEGSDAAAYGPAGRAWRPFGKEQQLPLAEYARLVAEQLGFAVVVTDDIARAANLLEGRSGVVLIDPWYIAAHDRRSAFGVLAAELPSWALPVLVPDPGAAKLTESVRDLLVNPDIFRSEPAEHGLRGVASLPEFVTLLPFLVAQAEREYLRRGPIERSPASSQAHLTGLGGESTNSAKEKPNA